MTTSRHIPAAIQRSVRQGCHFGCVICGIPLWQYDHIDDFAEVQKHTADNLVLLCPNHHSEKTVGMLDRTVLKSLRETPFNSTNETTSPRTIMRVGEQSSLILGGSLIQSRISEAGYFSAIWVNGETLLGYQIEDGMVLLDMKLRDHGGEMLLNISKGEAVFSTGAWDITWIGKKLHIYSDYRKINTQIVFGEEHIEITKGLFVDGTGSGIEVTDEHSFNDLCRGEPRSWYTHVRADGGAVAFAVLDRTTGAELPPHANYTREFT